MARLGRSFPIRPHLPKARGIGTRTFTVTGTWIAESTSVTVECWGGGGGGATGGAGGGIGAGGGAYSRKFVTGLTIGNTYTVTVGVAEGASLDGDDSWFLDAATVLAKGGKASGAGGLASQGIGDTKYSGGSGGTAGTTGGGGGGSSAGTASDGVVGTNGSGGTGGAGGVAPSGGGNGGKGGDTATNGDVGLTPGGGGGGGGSVHAGGSGFDGKVIISWPGSAPSGVVDNLEWFVPTRVQYEYIDSF